MKKTKITIDRFGRIVIPKKIRNDFGIQPGNDLIIKESREGFLITPVKEKEIISEEDGFLIITPSSDIDFENLLENLREERMKKITGNENSL
ncbi:MAG: AbrB/MazE/SpoVT family DNA-binding domain-containing protein [Actinobacteria bacterium]|nr:AbrB/MazE/SpoVT family DNA-binding domain-containing protein [Actinomycetota bacterium]